MAGNGNPHYAVRLSGPNRESVAESSLSAPDDLSWLAPEDPFFSHDLLTENRGRQSRGGRIDRLFPRANARATTVWDGQLARTKRRLGSRNDLAYDHGVGYLRAVALYERVACVSVGFEILIDGLLRLKCPA